MKTKAEQKQSERQAKKQSGLKRLELWVTPEEERLLKAYLVEHLRLRNQK